MGHSWLDDERRRRARPWGLSLLIAVPAVLVSVVLTVAFLR